MGVKLRCPKRDLVQERKKHHEGIIMSHHPTTQRVPHGDLPILMHTLQCQVIILTASIVSPGFCGVMLCHTARIPICITAILQKSEKITGKTIEGHPPSIRSGDAAMVLIRPFYLAAPERYREKQANRQKTKRLSHRPASYQKVLKFLNEGYCVDEFMKCGPMGRFIVWERGSNMNYHQGTAMVGIIKALVND